MKSITRTIRMAACLAAAAVMASCTEELGGEHENMQLHITRAVTFNICEIQTRTTFGQGEEGTYPTLWTAGDASVKLALNFSGAVEAAVVPSEDFRKAEFTADIDPSGEQAPYTFYAVSPASAARALSPSRSAWSVSIPSVQKPLDGSVDESAMLLAAASEPSDVIPQYVDLHFNHLTAYGRMSFANLDLKGATVDRVEITATTPFVGDWYWECGGEHNLTDNGASSTLTLLTSSTSDIWFACAPVDMSGEIAVITVYTDKGAFVKEIEFAQGRKFMPGRIAVFSVDMAGIEPQLPVSDDFVLLTDASQLKAGDEIVIVCLEGDYALGPKNTGGQTPYRQAVEVETEDGVITDMGSAIVLTLEAGSTPGTWALLADDGYLTTTSKKNSLSTAQTISDSSSWSFSITNSGEATIVASSGDYCYIRFNFNDGTNSRFSAYGETSSLQDPVTVYRKGAALEDPAAEDPLTEQSEYGVYLSFRDRVYQRGLDQYSRQYSDSGVETFAILYAYPELTREQVEITGYRKSLVKGDKLSVTVNWRLGTTIIQSKKTYNVTVVKEEGPKVWLGDGSGNGFIIKK